jgi:hypothetical protein
MGLVSIPSLMVGEFTGLISFGALGIPLFRFGVIWTTQIKRFNDELGKTVQVMLSHKLTTITATRPLHIATKLKEGKRSYHK